MNTNRPRENDRRLVFLYQDGVCIFMVLSFFSYFLDVRKEETADHDGVKIMQPYVYTFLIRNVFLNVGCMYMRVMSR